LCQSGTRERESGEDYIKRGFMFCILHQPLFERSDQEDRWAGHVAHMEERRSAHRFWWENLKEGDNLKDLGVDERKILKWILEKMENRHELVRSDSG
jgi:hypothetical protein